MSKNAQTLPWRSDLYISGGGTVVLVGLNSTWHGKIKGGSSLGKGHTWTRD